MRKLMLLMTVVLLFLAGCTDTGTSKKNVTTYNYDEYPVKYSYLKGDSHSSGDVYFLTLYLTSDNSPSPFSSSYSIYSTNHTLMISIVSDTPEITEGSYEFAAGNYEPFHFNYLQYYFLPLNQYGFATSGTLEVSVKDSEYTFDLSFKASKFVNSVDQGATVSIKSHYSGVVVND